MKRNSRPSTAERGSSPPGAGAIVVLGLDPGTLVTGFGVVGRTGGRMTMLECGSIRNRAGTPMASRLRKIHDELCAVIERHRPDEFAIESAFYGKNAQSALKLGHARGAAMLAAVRQGLGSTEYSPREVKKAVTGSGTSSKAQVRYMVRSILAMGNTPLGLDESDALAIAICHMHRLAGPAARHRNWASYVAAHPDRVVS